MSFGQLSASGLEVWEAICPHICSWKEKGESVQARLFFYADTSVCLEALYLAPM